MTLERKSVSQTRLGLATLGDALLGRYRRRNYLKLIQQNLSWAILG